MEWNVLAPIIGALGIGSIIGQIVNFYISAKKELNQRKYQEKREAYLGSLDALRKCATDPNMENRKSFGYWKIRVEVFGSLEVAKAMQGMIENLNDEKSYNQYIELMRKDLNAK